VNSIALRSVRTTRYRNLVLADGGELKDLNVLIGPNGSGKSNLIRLLHFLKSCVTGPPDDSGSGAQLAYFAGILGGVRMLDRSLKYPARIDIAYEFLPPPDLRDQFETMSLELGFYAHSSESPVTICFEALTATSVQPHDKPYSYYRFHDQQIGSGIVSYFDHPETRESHFGKVDEVPTDAFGLVVMPDLLEKSPLPPDMTPVYAVRRQMIDYVKKWHFYNANDMNLGEIRDYEPRIGPSDVHLSGSCHNLARVLDNLEQRHFEFDEHLNNAMKAILPLSRKVRPARVGLMGRTVQWFFEGIPDPFYLRDMSDGTVRMLCWATILFSPVLPTLLVIEEPELGIHPSWLPVLADWIKTASRRTQVIISTHSPDLLDHFTDSLENVLCFSSSDGRYFTPEPLSRDRLAGKLEEGWQLGDLYRIGDPLVGGWPW
jgi:predicted ATPase